MMKTINWKTLAVTGTVCLLPILLGIVLWDALPDSMAIHFNMNNEPDNFASKGFTVIGLPVLMLLLQTICCIINDVNTKKHGTRTKFVRANKWIIPVMSVILQAVTLGYNLGWNLDIRRIAVLIVGVIMIVIGNYLPKFDSIDSYDEDTHKAIRINRFIGYLTVAMGILSIITIFLPPIASVIWIFLLIPYAIINVIYGVKHGR